MSILTTTVLLCEQRKKKEKAMNEISRKKPMVPISVVADTLKVHQRTLRIWDKEKILVPKRTAKSRRLYSFEDIDLSRLIQRMTNSSVSLAGIKLFLALTKEMPIEIKVEEFEELSKELNLIYKESTKGRKKAAR